MFLCFISCRSVSCVPNVISVSELSIFDYPFDFLLRFFLSIKQIIYIICMVYSNTCYSNQRKLMSNLVHESHKKVGSCAPKENKDFEDTKGVIRISNSKKDRLHSGQKKTGRLHNGQKKNRLHSGQKKD